MRQLLSLVLVIVIVAAVVALVSGSFVLEDSEQALITEYGRPVNVVTSPGRHYKKPLVQKATLFPTGELSYEVEFGGVATLDGSSLLIDTATRWRISDVVHFYSRLRDRVAARSRLDDIVQVEIRHAIKERLADEIFEPGIRAFVLPKMRTRVADLGIEIIDLEVRITPEG